MFSNAEYIRQTCIAYIRAIEMGIAGDYWRTKLHEKLLEKTHLDEELLKRILHNLDKYINYNPPEGEDRAEYYGNKLFEVIKTECEIKARDAIGDYDTWKFLKRQGISIDEWINDWIEAGMEFDEFGNPVINRRGNYE